MMQVSHKILYILVAIMVLVWRFSVCPWSAVWRDWITILAAYWIYTPFRIRGREWPVVTVSVMAFLLGIYADGQVRHLGIVFGGSP